MTDFSNFLSNFAPWYRMSWLVMRLGAGDTHYFIYKLGNKKFNNKNEEENSVQSRLPRHVAEFW